MHSRHSPFYFFKDLQNELNSTHLDSFMLKYCRSFHSGKFISTFIIPLSSRLFVLVLRKSQDRRSASSIVDGEVEVIFFALAGLLILLTESFGLEAVLVYYYFV